MLAYSPIDSEETPSVSPPPVPVKKLPSAPPMGFKTETDYVVFAFVIGTLILIISDMIGKK